MAELTMKRVEFYDGALSAGTPANANGVQSGSVWAQGTGPLTDDSDDTGFRLSDAHAADVFVVFDGTGLAAAAEEFVVTIRYKIISLDPADTQRIRMSSVTADWVNWATYGQNALVDELTPYFFPGSVFEQVVTVNQPYLDADTGNAYMPSATPPYGYVPFRNALMAAPGSEVAVAIRRSAGAAPYEVDVTRVSLSYVGAAPAPVITGRPDRARRRFT